MGSDLGFYYGWLCWGGCSPGVGMGEFRAGPAAVVRRGCGARHPGLLALRSASGLGPAAGAGGPAPTAFNRAGEKVRATRGELPRVICEVILGADAGSLFPHRGEGLGHRCGCVPRGAAQAASAWQRGACWQLAAPEATSGSQPVSGTTMG